MLSHLPRQSQYEPECCAGWAAGGVREVDDQVWQVSFPQYDLGYFDRDQDRGEPGPNPFAPDKVLTTCPDRRVNHVTGIHQT
jgi:hypothetical protein